MSLRDVIQVLSCLSAATCEVVCGAGRRHRSLCIARGAPGGPSVLGSRRFTLGQMPFSKERVDVAEEVLALLSSARSVAAQRGIHLQFAVQPGLRVHTDPRALRDVLAHLLAQAVDQAMCGSVLVGARLHGGRVQIAVCDDGLGQDAAAQQAALRNTAYLLALQGATMQIDARPNHGTTVAIRLPGVVSAGPRSPDSQPAQAPASAPRHAPACRMEPAPTRG